MKSYKELSIAELKELQGELNKEYEEAKAPATPASTTCR